MTDETNDAAPAGAGEALSMSAAAALLAGLDEPGTVPGTTPAEAAASEAERSAEPFSDEAAWAHSEEAASAEAQPEPSEPDTDSEPESYVQGHARTRLRDGTVTTVGELKKLAEEGRELRARMPDLTAREQWAEAKLAHIAQQEQFFTRAVPFAMEVARRSVPPEPEAPDAALASTDPFAYTQAFARYTEQVKYRNGKIAEYRQLEAAAAAHHQQRARRSEEARTTLLRSEQQRLHERVPALASDETREAAARDIIATLARFDLTAEDIGQITDHRLMWAAHDLIAENKRLSDKAAAYDTIMAQKPQAEKKAAAAPPVAMPGRRATPAEARAQQRQELLHRAKQSRGRLTDIASIIAQIE